MITSLFIAIRALAVLTVITGLLYPVLLTCAAQAFFPKQAGGSLVERGDQVVGSALLAQKFVEPRYFWPRPSAADYATVASGANNQGFTSKKLRDAVRERQAALGESAPPDLLYASGSGLDPHISPEAAYFQAARVAQIRGLSETVVRELVANAVEGPQFGFLGQARVNVLLLNLALDELR